MLHTKALLNEKGWKYISCMTHFALMVLDARLADEKAKEPLLF
jgi:hypothetical protein